MMCNPSQTLAAAVRRAAAGAGLHAGLPQVPVAEERLRRLPRAPDAGAPAAALAARERTLPAREQGDTVSGVQ